jgi:hypothetical protein
MNENHQSSLIFHTVGLSVDDHISATELFQMYEWEKEEGFRLLFGAGLSFYKSKLDEQASEKDNADGNRKMKNRLMDAESQLSALRFRLYEMTESNRNWNLSTGAIQNENMALKQLVKNLREEIKELKGNL